MQFKKNANQSGQILLIVVLAAVVSLTVGLSAVSRTITNTRVTTEEANSQKALSAAEAGVEQLIQDTSLVASDGDGNNSQFSDTIGEASFKATVQAIRGPEVLLEGGAVISQDEGVDVWLSDYPSYANPITGTLTYYWNDETPAVTSPAASANCTALEIVIISDSTAGGGSTDNPVMDRYTYDACATGRGNGFTIPTSHASGVTIQGVRFNRSATLPAVTRGIIARVIPLYAGTQIAVVANVNLPSQGDMIESVGSAGDTTRRVRVFKGYPKLPVEYFPYSLFTP